MNDRVYREAKTLILKACNYFAIADAWENYTNVVSIMQSACDSSTSAIPILWRLESQKNPCVQVDFGSSCLRSKLVKVACLRATVLLVLLYSIMFYLFYWDVATVPPCTPWVGNLPRGLVLSCTGSQAHLLIHSSWGETALTRYHATCWGLQPLGQKPTAVAKNLVKSKTGMLNSADFLHLNCMFLHVSCMFLLISEFCVVTVFQGCGVSAWSRSTSQHWSGRRWGNKPSTLDSDLKWAPNPPFPSVSSHFGFQQKQRCLCVWNQNAGVQSPYCSDQLKCQHCWNSESLSAQNILCGTSYIRTAPFPMFSMFFMFSMFSMFPMFVPWFSRRLRFAKANGAESQAPHRCAGADRGPASLLPKEQDGHWDLQKSGAAHDSWGSPFFKGNLLVNYR